jgi:hypothetical protein
MYNMEQMIIDMWINTLIIYTLIIIYTVIVTRAINGLINILLWK